MPFLAPLITGALGLTGVAAAITNIALGVGLQFAANKLRPKQKSATGVVGARVGLTIDTNASRQVIIGETATGGSLVFWHLSGADNQKLWMVIALADHECTSLEGVIVNGKLKTWNDSTLEVEDFGADLKVHFYAGTASQTHCAPLASASAGRWTSSEVGKNVCYVVVEATYSESKFPTGIPELGFVVKGAKLYDPRTDTTAYSENPAVALYNVLRGISVAGEPLLGMNVPATAIRSADFTAAANACDEDVALSAGGTEKRYRCATILDCSLSNREAVETLLAAMAGEVVESGGIYRIMAGVAQSPVATLTDDDFMSGDVLVYRPKKGRNEIINAVQGSFFDPSRNYTPVGLPPRTSSTDETADGGIRLISTIDLDAVTSRTQAQRILEIERKRARRMARAEGRLRPGFFQLEPGDWVSYTSVRLGFEDATFEVVAKQGDQALHSSVILAQVDSGFDDWSTSDEIADGQVIDLPPAGPTLTSVTVTGLDVVTREGASGQQRPGLNIQWTPITDPTVTQIRIEFRKVGDTAALTAGPILDPSAGSYTWLDGVQGGVAYEARLLPVTQPQRSVSWSSWVKTTDDDETPSQVVAVAAYAENVNPDNLPPAELSAQEAHELSLVTGLESVQGSVNARLDELHRQISSVAASVSVIAAYNERQLRQITAQSNGNTIAITETLEAVGGADVLAARWAVSIDVNGYTTGLVQLSGDASESLFGVLATNFVVAQPGVTGGDPVQVFTIGNVNGVATIGFDASVVIFDDTILARHISVSSLDALSANVGILTAGLIRDGLNLYNFNLATGKIERTDGTMTIDLLNKEFEIIF